MASPKVDHYDISRTAGLPGIHVFSAVAGAKSNLAFLVASSSKRIFPKVSVRVAFLFPFLYCAKQHGGGVPLVHNFLLVVVVVVLQSKIHSLHARAAALRGSSGLRMRFDPLLIDPMAIVVIEDDEGLREMESLPISPIVVDTTVGAMVTYEEFTEGAKVLEPQPLSMIITSAPRLLVATDLEKFLNWRRPTL
ncbi:hypothetical protein AMTR_s00046p00065980 [Amborella trichopoda]|uniref:Uncharacterized protein n=1 Tax=Amborella trichopoda TaxID=13333 RepID=U5D676_AMBTC|nr:hypothetical protein AMTR_s00046p00065980 [Amborella trichopoda]